VDDVLDLSTYELASLWTPIVKVVDSSAWNPPDGWESSATKEDGYYYKSLYWSSMELICKMINGFHLGAPHQQTNNLQAQVK
jgi:hypothetical protein